MKEREISLSNNQTPCHSALISSMRVHTNVNINLLTAIVEVLNKNCSKESEDFVPENHALLLTFENVSRTWSADELSKGGKGLWVIRNNLVLRS